MGENGAGKSTLVQLRGPHLRQRPAGRSRWRGQPLAPDPIVARDQGLAVVWQDLALCDNLSVVANLFLGNERLDGVLPGRVRHGRPRPRPSSSACTSPSPAPTSPWAPCRAASASWWPSPGPSCADRRSWSLDEPTAALGITETQVVERLLAELRAAGTAVLLVSHRLDQVFRLVDRIAVLREGRIVAEVSPLEVHPDDVIALISGVEADSTARRQLHRLRSLVDQLAEVEPAASLPLIVSAMAEALGVDQLCVHLLEPGDGQRPARLRCSAASGCRPAPWQRGWTSSRRAPTGAGPGRPPTPAERRGGRGHAPRRLVGGTLAPGPTRTIRSSWSVPIAGSLGVLGTISGFADTVGRPQDDQLELVSLYASYAASAIEREVLLADATHRNRVLETLRGVLDTLAGPQPSGTGLSLALVALCRGLGADAIALHEPDGRHAEFQVTELGPHAAATASQAQRDAAAVHRLGAGTGSTGPDRSASTCWPCPSTPPTGGPWSPPGGPTPAACPTTPSTCSTTRPARCSLALEREALEQANAEAASLRRSNRLQQEFLSRLNHELRTPLTAIQGFASTLRQPDVSWDESSQQRFLDSIASESARMARLVGRPAGLQRHRLGDPAPAARLVRSGPGAGGGPGLRHRGTAGPVRHRRRPGPSPHLGRPRPAGAGLREPVRERRAPRRRAHPGRRWRPSSSRVAGPCWCGCPTTAPA